MPSKAQERWLPVPGYEGIYEVSDQGRVKSCARVVGGFNVYGPIEKPLKGRMLRFGDSKGYPVVVLCCEGSKRNFTVHRLVMAAFVGERPDGFQIAHGDGDPRNNALSNLRYATADENSSDMVSHGTRIKGAAVHFSVLNEDDVRDIKALEGEIPRYDIAEIFDVCYATISHIANGRTWSHVA